MERPEGVPTRQRGKAHMRRVVFFWCALASLLAKPTGGDVNFPLWTAGTNVAGQLGTERGLGTSQVHVTPVRLHSDSLRGQVVVALAASKGHTIVQTIDNAKFADVQYPEANGIRKCDPTSAAQRNCSTFIW